MLHERKVLIRIGREKRQKVAEPDIHDHDATYFFSLAHWAKEGGVLQPWERSLIFNIGRYIKRGWSVSEKQEREALRIIQLAIDSGFSEKVGNKFGHLHQNMQRLTSKGQQELNAPLRQTSLLAQLEARKIQLDRIGVDILNLTPGVLNGLKKADIHTIKQLSDCSEGDLLGIYEIGSVRVERIVKSLNSFLDKMLVENHWVEQAINEADSSSMQLFELASRLCGVFENYELLDDLQLPSNAQLSLYNATGERLETLADLKRLIKLHISNPYLIQWDSQTNTRIGAMEQATYWLSKALTYRNIDDEVNQLVGFLDDREQFVLINRFGIEKHLTLEEIGHQFQITRERVRQIEGRVHKKLAKRITKATSLFYSTAAVVLLKRLGEDATVDLWKQQLADSKLIKDESSADLLVAIGRATKSTPLSLPEELVRLLETHTSPRILSARKPVLQRAQKVCRGCGAIRVVSFVTEKLSEADVEQILCSDGFIEVYPGWWMKKVAKYVPERVARKVITYCGPVSPSNMRKALANHLRRFELPAPPSTVLVKILEQTGEFVLVDGLLKLSKIPTRRPVLTGPEAVFRRIVNSEDPIISFEMIHAKLLEEGFSLGSVTALLRYSSIVQKVATGLYTLLGTQYDAGDIEQAKSQLTRVSADSSMKPRSDGTVDFETNVGTWGIYSGVLSCGPAAKLEGSWTIVGGDGIEGEIVIGGGFIQGLSNVVKSLNLIPTDRIKIEFNTWTREATITKVVSNEQIS